LVVGGWLVNNKTILFTDISGTDSACWLSVTEAFSKLENYYQKIMNFKKLSYI